MSNTDQLGPSPAPSCGTCEYYMNGQCRRYAPTFTAFIDVGVTQCWFPVQPTDWCYEYSATARPSNQSCANCSVYVNGSCHQNPPIAAPPPTGTSFGAPITAQPQWPTPAPTDWCGDW